jgi:hypothetical protein
VPHRALARPLLLLAIALLLAAPARGQDATWYAETVAQSERGFLVTHYWSKGAKLRAETVIQGHRIVTMVSGELYTIVDALTLEGVAIRRSPAAIAEDAKRGRPFASELDDVLADGGEKVGEQLVNGVQTDVYRATDARGKSTVWVTRDEPRFPVRTEYYSRVTKQESTTSYVNWLSGLPIPDAFFEPDASVKLEHVSYDEYVARTSKEPVGPAPVLFRHLLHGERK